MISVKTNDLALGLDVSSSSIKAVVYSADCGILSISKNHYSHEIENISDLENFFRIFVETAKSAVSKSNSMGKISSLSLSTMMPSLILLDANNHPLTKIFSWRDGSDFSARDFGFKAADLKKIYQRTGCPAHASYPLWRLYYLKKSKHEIFRRAKKAVSISEFLAFKLTGKWNVSKSIASTTGFFSQEKLQWDKKVLSKFGIPEDVLSNISPENEKYEISNSLCKKIGLHPRAELSASSGDGLLCHFASGCSHEKDMSSTIGTTSALRFFLREPKTDWNAKNWCYYFGNGRWIYGMATNSGWPTVAELVDGNYDLAQKSISKFSKRMHFNYPYVISALAGERNPYWNENMTSARLYPAQASKDAEIFSAFEGTIFNLYQCYNLLKKISGKPRSIIASGGYASSKEWVQIQADIFNSEILVPQQRELSAVGAAMLGLGIEKQKNLQFRKIVPNSKMSSKYLSRYPRYERLYKSLNSLF